MGPYRFLFVFMDFNMSLCVLIGLYAILYVLMGPNWSSLIFMCPYGFLCVFVFYVLYFMSL